ncbi:MAG: hypothetical protein AAF840_10405, partial [Bacteroidota bacterium]
RIGDFFVGVAPSSSFSLDKSEYTKQNLPFLDQQLAAPTFLDIALGYQLHRPAFFIAASFRNPTFTSTGFGVEQTIKKRSFSVEVNKFLTDYTGFAPFIGFNLSYDRLTYLEEGGEVPLDLTFTSLEPGLCLGWDIIPGKTEEALILRTNLRWFPNASFSVDGFKFKFSQLEYNLIQVVFYPGRL